MGPRVDPRVRPGDDDDGASGTAFLPSSSSGLSRGSSAKAASCDAWSWVLGPRVKPEDDNRMCGTLHHSRDDFSPVSCVVLVWPGPKFGPDQSILHKPQGGLAGNPGACVRPRGRPVAEICGTVAALQHTVRTALKATHPSLLHCARQNSTDEACPRHPWQDAALNERATTPPEARHGNKTGIADAPLLPPNRLDGDRSKPAFVPG